MAGRPPTSAAERFVEKCKPAENGCIEWTGGTTQNGYGLFYVAPRMRPAHRWAYEQKHGRVPRHLDVCHRCDCRRCVNLDHLFVGTRLDNMQDAVAKGRPLGRPTGQAGLRGEKSPRAKLTDEIVLSIRQQRSDGIQLRELAERFGVSQSSIHNAVRGKTWSHL